MSQVLTVAPTESPNSSPRVAIYQHHQAQPQYAVLSSPSLHGHHRDPLCRQTSQLVASLVVNQAVAAAAAAAAAAAHQAPQHAGQAVADHLDTTPMEYEHYPVASTSAQPYGNALPAVADITDRQQAAGNPYKPVHTPLRFENNKGKQVEQPTYVNLPNTTPRSYTILKEVGDGSFGTVWLADWHSPLELPPGTTPPGPSSRPEYAGKRLVAIKRMKKAFNGGWDECMKLKELKSLRTISSHPNIIPLYDAFLQPESKELYFVFECMEGNLYQLTKSRKGRPLAAGLVANIFEQILFGLHHIHTSGFFHRDMKPENLLITTTGLADYPPSSLYALPGTPYEKDVVCTVKLADFGLARETSSKPPYTEYVSTRWYRAPEVLLRSRDYSNPVDMWALGTILAEMVNLKPLFPGQSEIDQVVRICEILGDPTTDYGRDHQGNQRGGGTWEKGIKMAKVVGFQWPKHTPIAFNTLFDQSTVSPQLIDCIAGLLRYEPKSRYTSQNCLDHPFFREIAPYLRPISDAAAQQQQQQQQQQAQMVLPPTPTSMSGPSTHQRQHMYNLPQPALPVSPPQSGHHTQAHSQHQHPQPDDFMRATWQAARHVSMANSVQSMPESIISNESAANMPWERQNMHLLPNTQANSLGQRRPTAASSIDYYDGSIFEGIAPIRDTSIYNFGSNSIRPSSGASSSLVSSVGQQQQVNQESQSPSKASKGWSLSAVFNQDPRGGSASGASGPPSANLKRTTSQWSADQPSPVNSSPYLSAPSNDQPAVPLDPKKAKKEAEKAAKAAEKARREAAALAARERARAVLQKKNQLGKNQTFWSNENYESPTNTKNLRSAVTEAVRSPALPKIAEYPPSRVPSAYNLSATADHRHKARRRDDDDDVHSISSNETRHSNEERQNALSKRTSAASFNVMDSDAAQRYMWNMPLSRVTTASSYGSTGSRRSAHLHSQQGLQHGSSGGWGEHGPPPPSAGSSVDYHLAQGLQGLSATDGSSTTLDAYSISMVTPALGSTAPVMHSLAYQQQTSRLKSAASGSFHSPPITLAPPTSGILAASSASVPPVLPPISRPMEE